MSGIGIGIRIRIRSRNRITMQRFYEVGGESRSAGGNQQMDLGKELREARNECEGRRMEKGKKGTTRGGLMR